MLEGVGKGKGRSFLRGGDGRWRRIERMREDGGLRGEELVSRGMESTGGGEVGKDREKGCRGI